MAKAKVGDIELYYETHGTKGPHLLLVRGLGSHVGSWDPEFVEALASETRLILFDNRGAGRSDKPDVEYSIPMMADEAAGLLDVLGVERAAVGGLSMGGMICQELALRHPDKTTSLILCCTSPGGSEMIMAAPEVLLALADVEGLTPEEVARKGWAITYAQTFIDENRDFLEEKTRRELPYAIPAFAFKRQMAAAMLHDAYDRLPEIECPTLVMTGSEDVLIPPGNSDLIAAQIPGSILKVHDGTGHGFMTEAMDAVAADILDFVRRHSS